MSQKSLVILRELSLCVDDGSMVLDSIDFEIKEGECFILKGVSGSGKTTLLGIIAGMQKPTSGEIIVGDKNIAKMPQHHLSNFLLNEVGIIFQNFNLLEYLSVEENVMAGLVPAKISHKEMLRYTQEAMQNANIAHKSNSLASTLSGGEKQRCAIARALANSPSLLLCDEPTANLDEKNTQIFIDMLRGLHKSGITVVVATHDPVFEELDFVTSVVKLQNGKMVDA